MQNENYPVQALMIERGTSSFGKYSIRVSPTRIEFFRTLAQADRWLLNAQIHGIPDMDQYQAYCD